MNNNDKELLAVLAALTKEEREALLKSHKTASDYIPLTLEEIAHAADANPHNLKRGASQKVLDRFNQRIADIFTADSVYVFVPYIQMVKEYDAIQNEEDCLATYLLPHEIKKLVRLYFLRNKHLDWMDRNTKQRRAMCGIRPDGTLKTPLNGYGRGPKIFNITAEASHPPRYLLQKRDRGYFWRELTNSRRLSIDVQDNTDRQGSAHNANTSHAACAQHESEQGTVPTPAGPDAQ
jgi:hypothetical protein